MVTANQRVSFVADSRWTAQSALNNRYVCACSAE